MGMRAWAILLSALVFSGVAGLAAGQVVVLPGTVNTGITSVSDDGTWVVGDRIGPSNYFWSAGTGIINLNHSVVAQSPLPLISGDGVSMLARSGEFATLGQPFIATAAGGFTALPFALPGGVNTNFPMGISRDGTVVSGWEQSHSTNVQVGWRWSAAGGMQVLPFQAALAMSGDGNTVFGSTGGGTTVVWRNGVVSPMPAGSGSVSAVNYDASVYAGSSPLGLTIWHDDDPTGVPLLPGMGTGSFTDVNEDGSVAVGINSNGAGARAAFIWTPAGGTREIGAYLTSLGFDLSAYAVVDAHVSADGRTFGLSGLSSVDGLYHGIVVTVPCPASAGALIGLLALGGRKRPS
jgi:uncharacterized membrane protein